MQIKLEQWCNDFTDYLQQSPVRAEDSVPNMISQDALKNIKKVEIDLVKIQKNILTILRVALIGEVKAGKSTLINALVGYKVSPTDMLEATSVIWEVGYDATDSTAIQFMDGEYRNVEHQQVMSIVGTAAESLQQAKRIEKIIVKSHQHKFKNLLLLDSPGLATVTQQNSALTKSIALETDLVVWVVNGNHLGQADIAEDIISIAHLGKPIIAVINKIDEIDEDPDELIEYLDSTSGDYLQQIFALSAFHVIEGNNTATDNNYQTLFNNFTDYLQIKVDDKAKTIKQDSVRDSCEALARRELIVHQSIIRQTREKIEAYDDYRDDLRRDKARIDKSLTLEMDKKYNELLKNKSFEQELKGYISNTNMPIDSELSAIMHRYNDPIKKSIEQNYDKSVSNAFEINSSQITDRFKRFQILENRKMKDDMESHGISYYDYSSADNTDIKDFAIKGGTVLGAGGTALAGYAAILGANASVVTVGAALSAVALPLVAVGVAAGAAYGFFKMKDKKENALSLQIHTMMKQMVDNNKQILTDTIQTGLEKNFREMEDYYIDTFCSGQGLNQQKKLLQHLENYNSGLYVFLKN